MPQSLIDAVVAEAAKQNVKPKDDDELQRTLPFLRLQLKALIARDLWDMSEYFSVIIKGGGRGFRNEMPSLSTKQVVLFRKTCLLHPEKTVFLDGKTTCFTVSESMSLPTLDEA